MSDETTVVVEPQRVIVREATPERVVVRTDDRVTVRTTSEGWAGPPGPRGPVGGTYTHTQVFPAQVWTVVHNLGYYPQVSLRDTAGTVMDSDVVHVDLNTLEIHNYVALSGFADCS